MFIDQAAVKAIVACRHWRMRGEHYFPRDARYGLVESDAFLLHAIPNRFQDRESTVAFVQVQNAGRDAHGFQGSETSHAQKKFLADTHASIAAVEA
jgi:hypothetical protein